MPTYLPGIVLGDGNTLGNKIVNQLLLSLEEGEEGG